MRVLDETLKPLAIDLYCGLGGWTEGLLANGWDVIGFDIERHVYGEERYPGRLVIQDVRTLHGSQFKGAGLIVASPPCQEYSYMAMPWSLAKAKAAAIRADESGEALLKLTELFDACFRIQREAIAAAGQHIPLVVENVRGAEPWVGRANWAFGSYLLWGDVPALMPVGAPRKVQGLRFDGVTKRCFQETALRHMRSGAAHTPRLTNAAEHFDDAPPLNRKAASAKIAKIPLDLASHIARVYRPLPAPPPSPASPAQRLNPEQDRP